MSYMPCENCGKEDSRARIKPGTGTLLCRKCMQLCECDLCHKLVRSVIMVPGTTKKLCAKCNRRTGG